MRALQFSGITFTQTAPTYMEPHGVPSGGDWALERLAALVFRGTEDTVIEQCTFIRLDGNALIFLDYHRDAFISRNEFAWLGASAAVILLANVVEVLVVAVSLEQAAWGSTKGTDPKLPAGQGPDGTDGNQPRRMIFVNNWVHEIGMMECLLIC